MESEKVVLVTVTYNSSGYLKRLIDAVSKQSIPLYRIVITDNASDYEHKEVLKQILAAYNKIDLLELKENLGGAGGFNRGMRYAADKYPEADWIWIMDDDAYPEADTMERLLDCAGRNGIRAICPVIRGIETGEYQIYHHKYESEHLNRDIPVFEDKGKLDEITKIDANSFVGPMIKMEVIRDIGFPDEQLFIEGDDTDYMYNIGKTCGLYLCRDAEVHHRDLVNNPGNVDPRGLWKDYYHCRNRMLFIRKYAKNNTSRKKGEVLYIKNILGDTYTTIKNHRFEGVRKERIRMLWSGIMAGLKDGKGKEIDPGEYIKSCDLKK